LSFTKGRKDAKHQNLGERKSKPKNLKKGGGGGGEKEKEIQPETKKKADPYAVGVKRKRTTNRKKPSRGKNYPRARGKKE